MFNQRDGGGGDASGRVKRKADFRMLLVGCVLGFLLTYLLVLPPNHGKIPQNSHDFGEMQVHAPRTTEGNEPRQQHHDHPVPVEVRSSPLKIAPAGERRSFIEWDESHIDSPAQIKEDLMFWEKFVMENAPADYRDRCLSVVRNTGSMSQANQDNILFHAYFRKMREPGVYLDLGAHDPFDYSNTAFFDKCLRWKGVGLEPETKYNEAWKKHRSMRLLNNCISYKDKLVVDFSYDGVLAKVKMENSGGAGQKTTATCRSLEAVLRENADILGEQDSEGKWGSKINYVSLDVEEYEPYLLGCTDLKRLFSTKPVVQLWTIETARLDGSGQRVVDSSMASGGWAKIMHHLHQDRSFLDDIYLQMPTVTGNPGKYLRQWRCRDGSASCAFISGMAMPANGGFSPTITCP